MRLAKLELLAYGHFRGVSLDFSAPGLQVVLGRNEAGKSTTLRAITGLLYGIDRATPDAHLHKPTELRIGGTLEHEGERLRVVRRKGNANTLLDPQDKPIDEAVLRRLLGGVTQETFVHAYGLDHVTLAEGARALLEGKGDLGESLFDASVGGGGEVQRILAELAREADAIYRPRGSSLPLNDALKAFNDASKQVKERRTLPEAYTQQEEGLATETEERDECLAKKKELEARRALIARARARAPRERQRQHLLDARQGLGAVPMHLARIDALKERFGRYERDVEQLRALRGEAVRLSDRLLEALRRAGLKNAEDLEPFRIDAGKEGKVNALLREREKLVERIQAATEEIARAERNLARLHPSDPASLDPAARDALAAALERARKLGDIEERVAIERARLDRQEQTLATKAAALRTKTRSLAALVALPLPSMAALDALAAKEVELGRKLARQDERVEELEREAGSIERQAASLSGDFAPPDAAALREARDARDAAWRELRSKPKAGTEIEIELERRMREADTVADRMIREADRVTTLARLRAEAEATRTELEKARAERTKLAATERRLAEELSALFEPARIVPTDVSDMRHWLERHAQIADAFARLTEARAVIDAEATKVARATAELATALAPKAKKRAKSETQLSWLEGPSAGGTSEAAERAVAARLADLVTAASTRLNALDEARRAAADIAKEELARDERLELRRSCNEQLSIVTKKLAEILAPIGLASDAPADEVNRAIEALRDVFTIADKRAETEARVREAHAATVDFEAALERCLGDAAPDLVGADAAARQLFDRAERARESAAQLANVEEQLAQLGDPVAPELLDGIVDLEAAEDELTTQIDELEVDIARYTENIGGIRKGLEAFRAEESAAEAAAAAEQHLARVRDGAERWARVRLASIILAREIERYREENQGPLLASASALFARLTLDAYSGIKAGFDDKDKPCLHCVRKDGTAVDVAGLSDGTRDQLYLSLRLASLLRRAEVAQPMPLILDDVLIQLDDSRASSALKVLAEVSRRMQVLFFTHHAHLVELAREAVDATELVVHTLGGDASPAMNVGGLAAVLR
jgi:uncharacterized protein YhaN